MRASVRDGFELIVSGLTIFKRKRVEQISQGKLRQFSVKNRLELPVKNISLNAGLTNYYCNSFTLLRNAVTDVSPSRSPISPS